MKPGRYDQHYLVQFWRERSQQLRQKLADREPLVITRVAGPAVGGFTSDTRDGRAQLKEIYPHAIVGGDGPVQAYLE
jgi:hypothetical protein